MRRVLMSETVRELPPLFERMTADQAGVPGHALRVARAVLSLNAFAPLLAELDRIGPEYDSAALLADVARVVAREAA